MKTLRVATFGGFFMIVSVLIDGGHLRVLTKKQNIAYTPDYIEKVAHACVQPDERLLRVLYYDCAPYNGKAKLPISGATHSFTGSDAWLKELAAKDYFATRLGVLKFRGFKPVRKPTVALPLTDADFRPDFEQKGVDMRIGLDIATYSNQKTVDRIILVTGDTDCIPVMKHARTKGLQIILVAFPGQRVAPELLQHSDLRRDVAWPQP